MIPARRLSFQNAISQFLEKPPVTGFSVIGITPEIPLEKSQWWLKNPDASFYVDRYSPEEVNKLLLYFCAYGFIDPGVVFGKKKNLVMAQLQAASGFRGKEFERFAQYIS
jgi:hypothetical protein